MPFGCLLQFCELAGFSRAVLLPLVTLPGLQLTEGSVSLSLLAGMPVSLTHLGHWASLSSYVISEPPHMASPCRLSIWSL